MRIRKVREHYGLTQDEFASQIGIKRPRLATYEECRAPLRFHLGLRICRQFITSEKWLALGEGHPRYLMDLGSEAVTSQIPMETQFSEAFRHYLAPRYEALSASSTDRFRILIREGEDQRLLRNVFSAMLELWSEVLAPSALPLMLDELLTFGLHSVNNWKRTGGILRIPGMTTGKDEPSLIERHLAGYVEQSPQGELTDVTSSGNVLPVKSKIQRLLGRIERATSARGKKAELARHLGVALPRISEWLSGQREPGGEYTLRLLDWVQAEEAKQTSGPGGVASTTGARTRLRRISDDKPKSSPPGS